MYSRFISQLKNTYCFPATKTSPNNCCFKPRILWYTSTSCWQNWRIVNMMVLVYSDNYSALNLWSFWTHLAELWQIRGWKLWKKEFVVCILLGNYPASGFYMPTFRSTLFHLHRQVDMRLTSTCLWRWNRQSVQKRRHIKSRSRVITQKKAYNIQNTAKAWNQKMNLFYRPANLWTRTRTSYPLPTVAKGFHGSRK